MRKIKGDKVIWAIVILLAIISFLAVYSSTGTLSYTYKGGNTSYYMINHGIILLFGLVLMYFAHLIKFTYYSRIFQILLIQTCHRTMQDPCAAACVLTTGSC